MAHALLLEQHVIDREDGAAGIAKENVDAMILQGFDHHFSAGHLFRHRLGFPFLSLSRVLLGLGVAWATKNLGNKKGPQGAFGQAPVAGNRAMPGPALARKIRGGE
jgi:hypothetical protein